MRNLIYMLDGKNPVETEDVLEWSKWLNRNERRVNHTLLPNGIIISTIFTGINSGCTEPPILFETMIFGGEHDRYQERYATWEEAEAGHQRAIELIFSI